jgi:hypothetical protein
MRRIDLDGLGREAVECARDGQQIGRSLQGVVACCARIEEIVD